MKKTRKENIVSIKELVKILNDEKVEGTYDEVDIVFIAGIFLKFMDNRKEWTKINIDFAISDAEKSWIHSNYFKQFEDLYNIVSTDIFMDFPKSINKKANPVSSQFIPPIFINEKSLYYFFSHNSDSTNPRIENLKNGYINIFNSTVFTNKSYTEYIHHKSEFESYNQEIKNRLENSNPIFAFTFIVACNRLRHREKRSIEDVKKHINSIWNFTEAYTTCLFELAKNIVEHGGEGEKKGQGMITIRAFREIDDVNNRVLETHVFDYGKKGVVQTLLEQTEQKDDSEIYKEDLLILKNADTPFSFSDFIEPKDNHKFLLQQLYREMAHYGLISFKHLIEIVNGTIIASTVKDSVQRDQYQFSKNNLPQAEIEEVDIPFGTSYYFEFPFHKDFFEKSIDNIYVFEDSKLPSSLIELQNFKLISSDEVSKLSFDKNRNYLIDFKIENFTKDFENIINLRDNENKICNKIVGFFSTYDQKLSNNYLISLDFDNVTLNKSTLLRILANISRQKFSNLIVYNVDYKEINGLIQDNENWFENAKKLEKFKKNKAIELSYWLKGKSVLFISRYTKNSDCFYFTDILYGEDQSTFYSINKYISKTFPNTTLLNKENNPFVNMQYLIPENIRSAYFHRDTNYLLPFDTILKSKIPNEDNTRELFLFNIKFILQNDLINRKTEFGNLEEYVLNFDGYHISDTHFKIGNKVHSSDFFYAKRLFQNSFYTSRIALHLAKRINELLVSDTDDSFDSIALIGYEIYSELFLSLVKKFLTDIYDYKKIIHFVGLNDDSEMVFKPHNVFEIYCDKIKNINKNDALKNKNIDRIKNIIIVPIAATGNTGKKIENGIKIATGKQLEFSKFNVILAHDKVKDFENIRNMADDSFNILEIDAKWHHLDNCILCYSDNTKDAEPLPLFETDNSSLTPFLIFDSPKGKTTKIHLNEIKNNLYSFGDLKFQNSLRYQSVERNNNYRVYDIDSDIFINDNIGKIEKWLKEVVLKTLVDKKIYSSLDNVIIIAPCHESNSQFINIVNEFVFSSTATIIHHQDGVDFMENFKLLNTNYLKRETTKIFYLDDSIISGGHFFNIYDLVRNALGDSKAFSASIFLNDQSQPFIHDRVIRWSGYHFSFTTFNQPPPQNVFGNHPLMQENLRYTTLQSSSLHDVLKQHFYSKTKKLDPKYRAKDYNVNSTHQVRRLKLFEVTHKIYEYFTDNTTYPDHLDTWCKQLNFELKYSIIASIDDAQLNKMAVLKAISQFPFLFYKDLKITAFKFLKEWINTELKVNISSTESISSDDDFRQLSTFKFLFRRAHFLRCYTILNEIFLNALFTWFSRIDNFIAKDGKNYFSTKLNELNDLERATDFFNIKQFEHQKEIIDNKEDIINSLKNFHIFISGNYIEIIEANPWAIKRLLSGIDTLQKKQSLLSTSCRIFIRMLQIESATVINHFTTMIAQEYRYKWRDLYKDNQRDQLNTDTKKIVEFFNNNRQILKTNKYELVKDIFLNNNEDWLQENTPFINFLWIKQLLYADTHDNKSQININYQTEIDEIIKKMKGFYINSKINAFLIVTDGQGNPHVVYEKDDNYVLKGFEEFYNLFIADKDREQNKNSHLYYQLMSFLQGIPTKNKQSFETTLELIKSDNQWKDIYEDEVTNFELISDQELKWIYLVRITDLKEHKGNCKFETQGVIGFFSTEDQSEDIFGKQLTMLVRSDLSAFINKHHKSSEFSALIQKKHRTDYQFMLSHGIDTYRNAVNFYLHKLNENKDSGDTPLNYEYLKTALTFLIGKIALMDIETQIFEKPHDEHNYERFTLKEFIDEFKKTYKYILSFHNSKLDFYDKDEINKYIEIESTIPEKMMEMEICYPKNLKEQIVFETIYNIRKHVIKTWYDEIDENKKLIITLALQETKSNYFLAVTNNYFLDKINSTKLNLKLIDNKKDGLNLINNILKRVIEQGIEIKVPDSNNLNEDAYNNTFTINIPLKNK